MNKRCLYFVFWVMILLGQNLLAQIKLGDNAMELSHYALLEMESSDKGLIVPRMTMEQRDAAFDQEAPTGILIFNLDANQLQYLQLVIDPISKEETKVWESATDGITTTSGVGSFTLERSAKSGSLLYDENDNRLYVFNGIENDWMPLNAFETSALVFDSHLLHYTHTDGATATVDLNSLTDSQMLTVNALDANNRVVFELTNGGSQTLDLSSLAYVDGTGTDNQILSITELSSENTVTFTISGGNSQELDLSSIANAAIDTDSQTLHMSALSAGNTFTLSISNGNSQTLDLSPLAELDGIGTDSQTLSVSVLSTGNTVTFSISQGNTQTLDLSSLVSTPVFITQNHLTSNASGTWTQDDFVFGSNQLDNAVGGDDDARFFFDKSKGAFRAGYASGISWNEAQIGERSFAAGYRTEASGDRSVALGNTAEAHSYAETALGSYNTIVTPNSTSVWNANDRLMVVGNGSSSAAKSDAMVILKNGNIGIGDATPTEATLVVSGTIVASGSITASATLTPDYVFESFYTGHSDVNPNYYFLSLEEVEAFIKENNHLPNVLNAAAIKNQGGIVLNRASEIQLEKIEELFLHTITQQKEIEALKKEIETLKAMIKMHLNNK